MQTRITSTTTSINDRRRQEVVQNNQRQSTKHPRPVNVNNRAYKNTAMHSYTAVELSLPSFHLAPSVSS